MQEGCGVSLDGLLWPITQTDPRPVSHGSYATVDVPPPYGHEVDTIVAASTLHHDGTTDAMMDFMLEPMDLAEDTTFLTQLFASKAVIASVAKNRLRWCARDIPLPQDVVSSTQHAMNAFNQVRPTDPTVAQAIPEPKEQSQNAASTVESVHRLQIEHQVEPLTGSNDGPITHCQSSPPKGRSENGTDPTQTSAHTRQSSPVQTSITTFFAKKPKKSGAKAKIPVASGQTTIRDFFSPQPAATTALCDANADANDIACPLSCAATMVGHDLEVTGRSDEHQEPDNQLSLLTLEKSEVTGGRTTQLCN